MKYDIAVIGSGPGGYVAAIRASQLGKKVVVIEKAELGGVCLNWGCIPTKALLKSAQVYNYAKHSATYGVDIEGTIDPNLEKIVARSRGVADTMSKGVAFLLKKNNVDIIQGFAQLKGTGQIEVALNNPDESGANVANLDAEHIILATGARPKELPGIPVDGVSVLNSRHALCLDKMPETMIVIGSGAIGSEFAYFYASLGVKVTVVEYLPNMMPLEDEEVSKYMERCFRKLRATVLTSTKVISVEKNDAGKCVVNIEGKKGPEQLEADIVLSAAGVSTNIENLGLEKLGVEMSRDRIIADPFGRTNVPGLYAIGDITVTPALAHVASAEAIRCVEKICGLDPDPIDVNNIPSCVYTQPEVASVGLTEKQVQEKGFDYTVGRFQFTASGKATAAGDRDGFVKLIFDKATDRLLGAHLVGSNVTEMISEPVVAKAMGMTAKDIAKAVHPHPTMSEAIMEAAEDAHGSAIHI